MFTHVIIVYTVHNAFSLQVIFTVPPQCDWERVAAELRLNSAAYGAFKSETEGDLLTYVSTGKK